MFKLNFQFNGTVIYLNMKMRYFCSLFIVFPIYHYL